MVLQLHLKIVIVHWVQARPGHVLGEPSGRARRTWWTSASAWGWLHDAGYSIGARLNAQQPWKTCQVLGLQKWFWIGVIQRKVTFSPVPFLSFTETMQFLRAAGALQILQDSPHTQILPSSTCEMWKIFL